MVRLLNSGAVLLFAFLPAIPAVGQAAPKPAPQTVQAELTTTIKASKAKPGDAIIARTVTALISAPGQVIPIGSKLRGHVRQVEFSPDKPHASMVAISFEEAEIANGRVLPLNLTIEAVMVPSATPSKEEGAKKTVSRDPGPLPNNQPVRRTAAKSSGTANQATKNSNSTGRQGIPDALPSGPGPGETKVRAAHAGSVIGLADVTLDIDDGPAHASLFRSPKSLKLSSGLQLMLTVPSDETH